MKVLSQVIFRVRMRQSRSIACAPYWFPIIGNLVAVIKCAMKSEANGLGRFATCEVPFDLMQDEQGAIPDAVAVSLVMGGRDGIVWSISTRARPCSAS